VGFSREMNWTKKYRGTPVRTEWKSGKVNRASAEDVEVMRKHAKEGPVAVNARLPHLTYQQVRYALNKMNLLGVSDYCRVKKSRHE
jgi:hypothetical protein